MKKIKEDCVLQMTVTLVHENGATRYEVTHVEVVQNGAPTSGGDTPSVKRVPLPNNATKPKLEIVNYWDDYQGPF